MPSERMSHSQLTGTRFTISLETIRNTLDNLYGTSFKALDKRQQEIVFLTTQEINNLDSVCSEFVPWRGFPDPVSEVGVQAAKPKREQSRPCPGQWIRLHRSKATLSLSDLEPCMYNSPMLGKLLSVIMDKGQKGVPITSRTGKS